MGKKNKVKKPKANAKYGKISIPRISESSDNLNPVFSFRHMNGVRCDHTKLPALLERFRFIGKISWREWKLAPKESYGLERIPRNALKIGIPVDITEEVAFLVFRFTSGRVIGYRDDIIFQIVYVDCEFKAYKH